MLEFLKTPEEWTDNGEGSFFHNFSPEYTIEFSYDERFKEPYTYYYTADNGHLGKAYFKYQGTVLFSLEYMTLDDGRSHYSFSVPSIKGMHINGKYNLFYYYDLSDEKGIFLRFLTKSTFDFSGRYSSDESPFLLFNNENELKDFEKYILKNQKKLDNFQDDESAKIVKERMKKDNFTRPGDPIFLNKVKLLYKEWKDVSEYSENESELTDEDCLSFIESWMSVQEKNMDIFTQVKTYIEISFQIKELYKQDISPNKVHDLIDQAFKNKDYAAISIERKTSKTIKFKYSPHKLIHVVEDPTLKRINELFRD